MPAGPRQRGADELGLERASRLVEAPRAIGLARRRNAAAAPTAAPRHAAASARPAPPARSAVRGRCRANHIARVAPAWRAPSVARLPTRAVASRQKCSASSGDVVATVAQRRQRNADDVEAIQQVEPEASGRDLLPQIAVGGGDQPHVDASRRCSRRRAEAPLPGSSAAPWPAPAATARRSRRETACPVCASSKTPGRSASAPGERTARVAEELRLDQVVGQRGAVQRAERPVAPRTLRGGAPVRPVPCRCRSPPRPAPQTAPAAARSMARRTSTMTALVPEQLRWSWREGRDAGGR